MGKKSRKKKVTGTKDVVAFKTAPMHTQYYQAYNTLRALVAGWEAGELHVGRDPADAEETKTAGAVDNLFAASPSDSFPDDYGRLKRFFSTIGRLAQYMRVDG